MNCAEARDLSPELAIGVLSGAERAEVLVHLNGCGRCQAYAAELTAAADTLAFLAPELEPSPGFEGHVLASLDAPRRGNRRLWIGAIAVAAAAAAILSITVVRVVESDDVATNVPAAGAAPVVAKIVGDGGQPAGWVSVSGGRAVTVAVDYGVQSGKYRIQLQPEHGTAVPLGTMDIDVSGRGFWAGSSNSPISGSTRIALVDASGREACHGRLATPQ